MLTIAGVLDGADIARLRTLIDAADWSDGNATSGHQSALAKRNRQLPEGGEASRIAGAMVLDALALSARFVAAALPLKVYPPLFNRYGVGEAFDAHVDGAVRILDGSDFRVRSDLSATLFLADPDSYDGGELTVETPFGPQSAKLAAGDLLLYPASSLHRVRPVTRGERVACFFWVQSMVRDAELRRMLLDLDDAIQALGAERGIDHPELIRLTGVYHNLLRRFADA